MGKVLRRHGTEIKNGLIIHDDRPVAWSRADRIAGRRLDRRKNYCIIRGQVCSVVSWTSACSGCSDGTADRGGGCDECGYHGVRRQSYWMPDDGSEPK